jgi:hypothetical protein
LVGLGTETFKLGALTGDVMASRVLTWSAVALALLFAGCAGKASQEATFLGLDSVPTSAPSSVGSGSVRVPIVVTLETVSGLGVVGAPVIVYKVDDPSSPPRREQHLAGLEGLGARTNATGMVEAFLEPGGMYAVGSTAPGRTREFNFEVNASRDEVVSIVLFNASFSFSYAGSFPPSSSTDKAHHKTGEQYEATTWRQQELRFHPDDAVHREYVKRLAEVAFEVRWNNTPARHGDLAAAVGFSKQLWWYSDAREELPADTNLREALTARHAALALGSKSASSFFVGPLTGSVVVTPDGLPFQAHAKVTFNSQTVMGMHPPPPGLPVPATSFVLAMVAVVGVVWSSWRLKPE